MTDIIPNKDGTITIKYTPNTPGIHEMTLSHNDKTIDGMPIRCHVDENKGTFVTAYGSGLYFGGSGKEGHFEVASGGVPVDVNITGPGKVDIRKNEVDKTTGNLYVSYVPMSPGEYEVSLKTSGKHIHGSPFNAKISDFQDDIGEGRKRSQFSLAASSEMTLGGGSEVDLTNMIGTIKTPDGNKEFCLLKKMSDGQLGIASFTPHSKGIYLIEATQDGRQVRGSPFKIDVGENGTTNAGHVLLEGEHTKVGVANEWNELPVDISKAGHGALSFVIEGEHRSDIECSEDEKKRYVARFKPHEPGIYMLTVKFGDEHVTGSPFVLTISGVPSGRVRETFTKQIDAAGPSGEGVKCEFQLKIPGTNPLDMEATLTSPSSKNTLCEIIDLPDNLYDINFTPKEEGIHIVSLKYKGLHIAGSPFQYTVGSSPNGGPLKVEIGGPGCEKAEVGSDNEFNIYTREAGAGELSIGIEGPSKATLVVKDRGNGYTTVCYRITRSGEYGIHVKYNDVHVPKSPSMIYATPHSGDAKSCSVHGLKDRGIEVGKPVTFTVQLNGVIGSLNAHVDTPSGTVDDCFVQELDIEVYALRFIPRENGVYYITVKFKEAHIPGSPFPMIVGKMGADPALVSAKGDGLVKGETGQPTSFVVNTTNCGTGTLNICIVGPSRVAIRCSEVDEGYEFRYTPMAPGEYIITIKYCNVMIAACPKLAVVTGKVQGNRMADTQERSSIVIETAEKKPGQVSVKKFHGDASKIVLKGLGLKKAFTNRAANFTIDVQGAGNQLLTIGMVTPTGNPIEELTYKKTRNTIYTVAYRSKEKGPHQMIIRWGSDDVPGSPLMIPIN